MKGRHSPLGWAELLICAGCKKIRNHEGIWEGLEVYIEKRSEARFTHGICPECSGRLR